jgi:transcriptional regulator with XRE-family HTH domain
VGMEARRLVAKARARSGLSQRQLARRAGTSAAAICNYESGAQVPRFDTLVRIVEATGGSLVCEVWRRDPGTLDLARNARILEDVLDLADHLPHRATGDLEFPPFAATARAG